MWRYLEPLFVHSDEVKKELPLDTKRFEKIDGEVKATLMELWKVKKVRSLEAMLDLSSCDHMLAERSVPLESLNGSRGVRCKSDEPESWT